MSISEDHHQKIISEQYIRPIFQNILALYNSRSSLAIPLILNSNAVLNPCSYSVTSNASNSKYYITLSLITVPNSITNTALITRSLITVPNSTTTTTVRTPISSTTHLTSLSSSPTTSR